MKNLLNREKMTNATLKRLFRYADANDIYELITLAKSEGAKLGRKEVDKKINATQYYIDKYNNEIITERERIKEEQKSTEDYYGLFSTFRKDACCDWCCNINPGGNYCLLSSIRYKSIST